MNKAPYSPALKAQSTLTSKGQITLPVELRRRWGLKPGDRLDFTLEDDGRVVVRKWLRRSIFEIGELLPPVGAEP
ncbi:MAG TPA: AbrB/MazE/SpoVT family DNA-binding domain-containing protein [Xanthobacteraceae bacterium]|jgi:AbrB family looped-hinge helix DNA binding protein|nr:AbrB/MazE/SpoVT family DNA-binding domain-containing protein [Xanthobacteraceae bacterium]